MEREALCDLFAWKKSDVQAKGVKLLASILTQLTALEELGIGVDREEDIVGEGPEPELWPAVAAKSPSPKKRAKSAASKDNPTTLVGGTEEPEAWSRTYAIWKEIGHDANQWAWGNAKHLMAVYTGLFHVSFRLLLPLLLNLALGGILFTVGMGILNPEWVGSTFRAAVASIPALVGAWADSFKKRLRWRICAG